MAITVGRRKLITIVVAIAVLGLVGFTLWGLLRPLDGPTATSDKPTAPLVSQQTETANDAAKEESVEKVPASTLSPEEVSEVTIDTLAIKVSYVKGIPGFSYSIGRAGNGTQYVDFSADALKGTKCTDDEGVFATILENPDTTDDAATLTFTKEVGSKQYGLSLPTSTCTGDAALFAQYQAAFEDAFSLLQAL
jgi:cytoskeletal protein RodZ